CLRGEVDFLENYPRDLCVHEAVQWERVSGGWKGTNASDRDGASGALTSPGLPAAAAAPMSVHLQLDSRSFTANSAFSTLSLTQLSFLSFVEINNFDEHNTRRARAVRVRGAHMCRRHATTSVTIASPSPSVLLAYGSEVCGFKRGS
ncbi:hypothetical protein L9F63_022962, partial [Diploptera punctata]